MSDAVSHNLKGGSSQRRNSALVKQLCEYTAKLEQTNIDLQEQLMKIDQEHDNICSLYGYSSWQEFYRHLVQNVKVLGGVLGSSGDRTRLVLVEKQKSAKSLKVLTQCANNYASDSSRYAINKHNFKNSNNEDRSFRHLQQVQHYQMKKQYDGSSGRVSWASEEYSACNTPIHALSSLINQSPHEDFFSKNSHWDAHEDGEQSPIRSESRVLSRSIRGDTDRIEPEPLNGLDHSHNQSAMEEQEDYYNGIFPSFGDFPYEQLAIGSENSYKNYQAVYNKDWSREEPTLQCSSVQEDDNLLLSMQNTKLRQKLAKLEAVLESRKYTCPS